MIRLPVAAMTAAALLISAPTGNAHAQAAPPAAQPAAVRSGEVHGRVVTVANGSPVRAANIVIMRANDTTIVARSATRDDGVFSVDKLEPGRYHGQVRTLGFSPGNIPPFTITNTTSRVNVGSVLLAATAVELQRLTVIEQQRRAIELAPDRNTFAVRDMPTTRGGSAIDVLRNIPSVDVDIDNGISLRGDGGVIVQINGRRSPMKPAQLGNFLAQLPAAMVEKVEIIPNPSARENPEGSAGIINVVLKKEVDAGSSGGITLAQGTTGRTDVGGNVGYQKQQFTFFGSYGFLHDSRPRTESLFRQNLYASPLTFLDQHADRTQRVNAHTLTSALTYKPNKQNEISSDLLFSTRVEDGTTLLLYHDLNATQLLTGLRDRASTSRNDEGNLESTTEFKHAFAGDDHELTTELRFARSTEGGASNYTSRTLTLAGAPIGADAREMITPRERPTESSLKMDYARPLAEHLHVSAGYLGSLEQFHTTLDTRLFSAPSNDFIVDPARTNRFTFDQTVHAVYGILTGANGKIRYQGGVRAENAGTRFRRAFSALSSAPATAFDNHYNSVFPSGLIAYDVDESEYFKLSYSTRIRRPEDTDQLDPTPQYQDPLNISRGNPSLKPEYIRAIELGFQKTTTNTTLQITPYLRHTIDAVRRIRTIDSAGVTTTTFANIATTDNYGADATLALHGGKLTGFVGSSAFRQVSNASNISSTLSAKTFGWTARANASLRVSKTFDMQTIVSYRGKTTVEQGTNGAQTRVSFAARQKLRNDRVSLTLRVTDPFGTERERSTVIDPKFTVSSERWRKVRGVLLNVTWNFGRPQKEKSLDQLEPPG